MNRQSFPAFSKGNLFAFSCNQRVADSFFQALHLQTDGRLRAPEDLGCTRETGHFDDSDEGS